jgi:hypothetical protein
MPTQPPTSTTPEAQAEAAAPSVLPAPTGADVEVAALAPGSEEQEVDDPDSVYGDDAASSTASLSASILDYRKIHGRTFHSAVGNAEYWYGFESTKYLVICCSATD